MAYSILGRPFTCIGHGMWQWLAAWVYDKPAMLVPTEQANRKPPKLPRRIRRRVKR